MHSQRRFEIDLSTFSTESLLAAKEDFLRARQRDRISTLFPDTGPLRRELYVKHCEFFRLGREHQERCFMAGNRSGKTTVAAYEMTLHLTGDYPHWWEGRRFDEPIDAWAAGDTSETTRDIVQLALLGPAGDFGTGLIPWRELDGEPRPKRGVADSVDTVAVKHVSGGISTLGFKSYDSSSWKGCLPAWNGQVNEQDGRLNQFLRTNAQSHDARLMLARAVWLRLNLNLPGNVQGVLCGGNNGPCATALAQLAVSGREAFNSFVRWDLSFAPASSGPQVSDLVQLVKKGQAGLPAIAASFTDDQLTQACTAVLHDAYTALWAIRSNQLGWRQFRQNFGWIAVSGEDDAPHRPVNVFTAPFPQFDVAAPVVVGGKAAMITTRYMIAAGATLMNLAPGAAPTTAPPIPSDQSGRLTIPNDSPDSLLDGQLFNKNVIIYIHGGGSRLEEAVPMATRFVRDFFSSVSLITSPDASSPP